MALKIVSIFALAFTIAACSDHRQNPKPQAIQKTPEATESPSPAQDMTYEAMGTIAKGNINFYLSLVDSNLVAPYDVALYKVFYTTETPAGDEVRASGLLTVPVRDDANSSPLLAYQHGTIYLQDEAPSANPVASDVNILAAGMGYVTAAADYIGYGASAGRLHNYLHAKSLGENVVDLLRAARAFTASQHIPLDQHLFLAGYSEGGYATMAAHKLMESEYANEFKVTASAPGAGPFDITGTSLYFARQIELAEPVNVMFVMKSYDAIYGLPIDEIIQAQHMDVFNAYFDGRHSMETIQASLGAYRPDALFEPDFLDAFIAGLRTDVMPAMADNDIYDWQPQAPVRLYQGNDDTIVPPLNAWHAYTAMLDLGAPVEWIECQTNDVADHSNCFWPYVISTAQYFQSIMQRDAMP